MADGGFSSEFMRHYQQAFEEYPELLDYDQKFQRMVRSVGKDFCLGRGEETSNPCVLPFHVLMEVILYVVDNSIQSGNEILTHREEIGGINDQILQLVRRYFNLGQTTLDFLKRLQVKVRVSINKLTAVHRDPRAEKVQAAIRSAEGVVDEFFLSLPSLIDKHVQILIKLQQARGKDIPVGAVRPEKSTARKVAAIMLVSVFATAVICSFLVAALQATAVLVALPAAVISITSWAPFITWLNGFLIKDEEALRRQASEGVLSVEKKRNVLIGELEEIKLLTSTTVSLSHYNTTLTVDRKRDVLDTLLKNMAELNKRMEKGSSDICMASSEFLSKTTEPKRRRDRVRIYFFRQAARIGEKTKRPFQKMSEKFDNLATNRKF